MRIYIIQWKISNTWEWPSFTLPVDFWAPCWLMKIWRFQFLFNRYLQVQTTNTFFKFERIDFLFLTLSCSFPLFSFYSIKSWDLDNTPPNLFFLSSWFWSVFSCNAGVFQQTVRLWQGSEDGNYDCKQVLREHTAEVNNPLDGCCCISEIGLLCACFCLVQSCVVNRKGLSCFFYYSARFSSLILKQLFSVAL